MIAIDEKEDYFYSLMGSVKDYHRLDQKQCLRCRKTFMSKRGSRTCGACQRVIRKGVS